MSTSTEFVTREEFLTAIDLLNRQVQGLYNLADRMGYTVDVPEGDSVPESVSDASAPSVLSSVQTTDNTNTDAPVSSGVDYGAVAYGLSEIKAKFRAHLGTSDDLTREYEGAVEWFVGCFAGDASFDANAFRAAAGSSARVSC